MGWLNAISRVSKLEWMDGLGAPPVPVSLLSRKIFTDFFLFFCAGCFCAHASTAALVPSSLPVTCRTLLKRMPADVNVALLRGGNSMGSRGIKEAIKNETVHVVSRARNTQNRRERR